MDLQYLYTSIEGRISRKAWWLGAIGLFFLALIANAVVGAVLGVGGFGSTAFGIGLTSLIVFAALFVPYRALVLKRLHDRDRPENLFWIFLAPSLASTVITMLGLGGSMVQTELFGVATKQFVPNAFGVLLSFASLGVSLWALYELGIAKGDAGPNAHGSDPLGSASENAGDPTPLS